MIVYLDNSSTTRPYKEAVDKAVFYMTQDYGNPSSLHRMGLDAERAVREAREAVAKGLGATAGEIYFTSGGTEADNMAIIKGAESRKRTGNRIITTKVEHPAVLEPCEYMAKQGFEVVYIDVDSNGCIDMEQLKNEINDRTILISVMHVNNELGSINPIAQIAKLKGNALFHSDAVQSFCKEDINAGSMDIDMISVSGHKIHGPKGIGAIYVRKGANLSPYIMGGGQEKAMRSGTENVPAIAGFGAAADISYTNIKSGTDNMKAVRAHLLEGIRGSISDIRVNSPEDGCPSVLNVSFLGTRGEVLLHILEDCGIYVSTGSACSSNKRGQSHVLKAIGLTDREIEGALRFSFSEFNTIEEMDYVLENLTAAVKRFRRLGTFR
jgi:cysteine desulfurase